MEYLNPSFLVQKPSGGYCLVTAFADVGRYSKPQPSLLPDVNSILRTIAQWKFTIVSDLTSALYQIPLAKQSMKYCGVATPFRGVRAYTRCAIQHLAGSANIPSDFSGRNAPKCNEPQCQICNFISTTEDSVVRSTSVQDIHRLSRLSFTTRSAWIQIQSECPDLPRVHAHLKQGTRPSKKITNLKDVKRYLNIVTIAKDGLLVVQRTDPFASSTNPIVVPRTVLDGLVTALHIKLDHPTKHQLQLVMKRNFFALDLAKSIDHVSETCHKCAALRSFPQPLTQHSTEDPPEEVGISLAADVLKCCKQLILVLRETTTSFTVASIVADEKSSNLCESLASLCCGLRPLEGPPAVIRVDTAPGFVGLRYKTTLRDLGLSLEFGRVKNPNKNPVAEKAISEQELLCQVPNGGPVTNLILAMAISRLNSRLRRHGISSREMWTQRDQFTHAHHPISDRDIISDQHKQRIQNDPYSERCKDLTRTYSTPKSISVGDLVFLPADHDKTQPRSRYLVVSVEGPYCFVKKFSGNQLRASSYKVKTIECQRIPSDFPVATHTPRDNLQSDDDDLPIDPPIPPVDVLTALTLPMFDDLPQPLQDTRDDGLDNPVRNNS